MNRADAGMPITDDAPTETWDGRLASMSVTDYYDTSYTDNNLFRHVNVYLTPDPYTGTIPF
jgi:hypothetical protein